MKKLLIYLFFFVSFFSAYSQKYDLLCNPNTIEIKDTIHRPENSTKKYFNDSVFTSSKILDSIFFDLINQYREFHQLEKLKWSNEIYQMSRHHTIYQVLANLITDYEFKDVQNFMELTDARDRLFAFSSHEEGDINYYLNEDVDINAGFNNLHLDSTSAFTQFVFNVYHKDVFKEKAEILSMLNCIFQWDQSKPDQNNLLSTDVNIGAISYIYFYYKIFNQFNRVKVLYSSFITFNSALISPRTSYYKDK